MPSARVRGQCSTNGTIFDPPKFSLDTSFKSVFFLGLLMGYLISQFPSYWDIYQFIKELLWKRLEASFTKNGWCGSDAIKEFRTAVSSCIKTFPKAAGIDNILQIFFIKSPKAFENQLNRILAAFGKFFMIAPPRKSAGISKLFHTSSFKINS